MRIMQNKNIFFYYYCLLDSKEKHKLRGMNEKLLYFIQIRTLY